METNSFWIRVWVTIGAVVLISSIIPAYKIFAATTSIATSGQCSALPFQSTLTEAPNPQRTKSALNTLKSIKGTLFSTEHSFTKGKNANAKVSAKAALIQLASQRKGALLQAMENDPTDTLNYALLSGEQGTVSQVASDCIEHTATVQGHITIIDSDNFAQNQGQNSEETVLTTDAGDRIKLNIAGTPDEAFLTSGGEFKVTGFKLDHDMLINGTDKTAIQKVKPLSFFGLGAQQVFADTPASLGPQSTVVILVNFQDATTTATIDQANDMAFNQVNTYYSAISNGQTTFVGTTVGPYNIDASSGNCSVYNIEDATLAAVGTDVNFGNYSHIVIVGPYLHDNCGIAGVSTIGPTVVNTTSGPVTASVTWLDQAFVTSSPWTLAHELGHSLGLNHADFYSCGTSPLALTGCSAVEYGDQSDVMGLGHLTVMNGVNQDRLGWLSNGSETQGATGDYTISAIGASSTGLKVVKIPRAGVAAYNGDPTTAILSYDWVYYRQPEGYDVNQADPGYFKGALVDIDMPYDAHSYLLGNAGGVPSSSNPALPVGQTFTDPASATQITVTGTASDTLSFHVAQGKTDFTPPTVNITAPVANATVSGTITMSVDATADGNSGIQKVDFYSFDSFMPFATATSAPYTATFDTTQVPDGTDYFYAVATDNSGQAYGVPGNVTTSTFIPVVIDNFDTGAPTTSITSPSDGATVSSPLTVNVESSDDEEVADTSLYVDGVYNADLYNITSQSATTTEYAIQLDLPLGTHTLLSVATDEVNNMSTSTPVTVTVEAGPDVAITSPVNNAQVTGSIPVTADASSTAGISQVQFYVDGTLFGSSATAPYSATLNTSAFILGSTHEIVAQAYDAIGLSSSSTPVDITVPDTTPPTVAITAPANGSAVSGTVAITATSSDNGSVSKVLFYIDGILKATDTASPYSYSWNTNGLTIGSSHTLIAQAYDEVNNTASSSPINVTIADVTPPAVSLTAPAQGSQVTGTVPLSATASDNVGVSKVEFYIDGSLFSTASTAPYTASWNTSSLTAGTGHTVQAKAYDAAGNTASSSLNHVTIADTTPPSVAWSTPGNGSVVSGLIYLSATSTDNVAVKQVNFYIDGTLVGSTATSISSLFSVPWSTSSYAVGSHTLYAAAYDTSGNGATTTPITLSIADVTPPAVSITAPTANSTVSGTTTITAFASDNVAVARVDFFNNTTLIGSASTSPYSVLWGTYALANGNYNINATAYDTSGNKAFAGTISVTISNTIPPTVTLTAPANGIVVSGSIPITATASGISPIKEVDFYRNNSPVGLATTTPYTYTWNTAGLSAGSSYTWQAIARDDSGNSTSSASSTVTIADTTAPSVTWFAPNNGTTVSGIVSVSTIASDNVAVAHVDFYVDGGIVGSASTSTQSGVYSVNWNTAGYAVGSHSLYSIAYDTSGNTATTTPISVTMNDTIPPTVSLTAPSDGAVVTGSVSLSATASDNVGVSKVEFYVDNALYTTITASPYNVSWNTSSLTAGTVHTIQAKAYDAAGNTTLSTIAHVTIADITPPTVSITTPTAGSNVTGTTTISATASDNVAVSKVEFYVDSVLKGTSTASPYSYAWSTTGLIVNSSHSLVVKAYDTSNNTASSSAVSVTIADVIPPTVSLTAPTDGSSVTGTVPLSATASDNVGVSKVEFYVDGSLLSTASSSPYGASWNTSSLTAGTSHTVQAKAYDAAGNATLSNTAHITISDVTPPTVSISAPANGSQVTGTTTISATASDNVAVAHVDFYVDSILKGTSTASPYTYAWNTSGLTVNSSHSLVAKAYDTSNNTASSTAVSVTIADVTPPTVSITAPTNGAQVTGTTTISATASDNVAIGHVDFYVDGILKGTSTVSPYNYAWNTSALTAGSAHVLTAQAYDTSNNTASSSAISVTIADTIPPTVSITSPASGTKVTATTTISATASDNIAVSKVQFYVDGILKGTSTASPYSYAWNTAGLAAGTSHALIAQAYDTSNNTASSTAVSVTIADVTPPTVSITAPTAGSKVTGTTTISATASDNVGVAHVDFYVDNILKGTSTASPYSYAWSTSGLTVNSSHSLVAKAYDAAGNTASSTAVAVTIADVTAPTTSITSPTNNSQVTHSTNVTISATASDNVGVTKVEFYVNSALTCTTTSSPYSCVWAVPSSKGTAYSLQTKAYDAANNIGSSTVVKVTSK
jgi:hypothetical protein